MLFMLCATAFKSFWPRGKMLLRKIREANFRKKKQKKLATITEIENK